MICNNKMKFLLINKYLYLRGGTETYLFNLAKSLEERGFGVCYFGMLDSRNVIPDKNRCFIPNSDFYVKHSLREKIRILSSFSYSKEAQKKLKRLIDIEHPDVAVVGLVHGNLTSSIFEILHSSGVKTIYVNHDYHNSCPASTFFRGNEICTECRDHHYRHCLFHRCIKNSFVLSYFCAKENYLMEKKKSLNFVDAFVSPSLFMKDHLTNPDPSDRRNYVMYNYIPNERLFDNAPVCRGLYLLYFGRLAKEKGVDLIIDSLSRLKDCHINLIIAGRGPEERDLRERASKSGARSHIFFVGFQTGRALQELIIHSSFVVYPSKWYENCPYSVIESLGLKKPVIIAHNGGMAELVNNGETGFVFETDASRSLDNALLESQKIDDKNYYEMSEKAFNSCVFRFSENNYLNNLLRIVNSI